MDDHIGKYLCSGCCGSNNVCSSYPVKRLQPTCYGAPNKKAKQAEEKGANGKNIVPLAAYAPTPKAAASRKKQEVVKVVSGFSKVKDVYSCSNPTKTKTKISAAVRKKQAKGTRVGVVASYESTTKVVVVSVEKEESVKIDVAGFLGF